MKRLSEKQQTIIVAVFLAVVTIMVFWQVRSNDFIDFDDDIYITKNSNIQAPLNWQTMKWAFTTNHAYNWHPLVWISHAVDWQIYGSNPAGHHFTNVLFHTANVLLLFCVLKLMTGCLWRSALVTALFALHPLHVESVVWISERKDVLSTFFWMLTMLLYARYARQPSLRRYLVVSCALALGLMAKQMLVTLPLVLLLLDYWPLRRFDLGGHQNRKTSFAKASFGRCLAEKLPLLVLSAVASTIVFLIQSEATLVKKIPLGYRAGNAVIAYAEYIAKMFWPVDLGILYPHLETAIAMWQVLAGAAVLVVVSILVIANWRNRRWLAVGWLWYLGTLVPVIGLVQVGHQAMADRYTYVPLTGLFIIIAWWAGEFVDGQKYRKIAVATAIVIVFSALTALTSRQIGYWKNSITLYEHTVAVTANNDILHYNLGMLLAQKGQTSAAIEHWKKAVEIKADQPTIHKNLAILLSRQGRNKEAIKHYQQALRYKPNDKVVRKELKKLLARQRKRDITK